MMRSFIPHGRELCLTPIISCCLEHEVSGWTVLGHQNVEELLSRKVLLGLNVLFSCNNGVDLIVKVDKFMTGGVAGSPGF